MKTYFLIAVLLLIGLQSTAHAQVFGQIVKYEGSVKVLRHETNKSFFVTQVPFAIFKNDKLFTGKNSKAFLSLSDNSKMVVLSKTEFIVRDITLIKMSVGKVIMDIVRRTVRRFKRFRIKTASAVIGVKGTRFMVNSSGKTAQIYLKSGQLSVEAIEGKFRRIIQKLEDDFDESVKKDEKDFDDFVKKQDKDFDEFVDKQEKAFEQFVKHFEIKSGQSIVISGQEVRNIRTPKELDQEFKLLDNW
jgi:hypothetical protein